MGGRGVSACAPGAKASGSVAILQRTLPPSQLEVRELPDSYHVATLDNDAPAIFDGTLAFIKEHTAAGKRV